MAACRLCHIKELPEIKTENKPDEHEQSKQLNNVKKGLSAKRRPLEAIDNIDSKRMKLVVS